VFPDLFCLDLHSNGAHKDYLNRIVASYSEFLLESIFVTPSCRYTRDRPIRETDATKLDSDRLVKLKTLLIPGDDISWHVVILLDLGILTSHNWTVQMP